MVTNRRFYEIYNVNAYDIITTINFLLPVCDSSPKMGAVQQSLLQVIILTCIYNVYVSSVSVLVWSPDINGPLKRRRCR